MFPDDSVSSHFLPSCHHSSAPSAIVNLICGLVTCPFILCETLYFIFFFSLSCFRSRSRSLALPLALALCLALNRKAAPLSHGLQAENSYQTFPLRHLISSFRFLKPPPPFTHNFETLWLVFSLFFSALLPPPPPPSSLSFSTATLFPFLFPLSYFPKWFSRLFSLPFDVSRILAMS